MSMNRVLDRIEELSTGVSAEQMFLEGYASCLDDVTEILEDELAEAYALNSQDNLMEEEQFEDTMFEVVTLDEDGEDAAMIGVTWNLLDAAETAILESSLSGALVMVKTVDTNTNRVLFTKIYGGQF